LSSGANRRDDRYGGSPANRGRFVLEALQALAAQIGSDRIGIKIAPELGFNGIVDAAPRETYRALIEQIRPLRLAYLHVAVSPTNLDYHELLKPAFDGAYFVGRGLTRSSAEAMISGGRADAAVFGSSYVANPDLVQRFLLDAPLNLPDRTTFYSPGVRGYTDYPLL
jgi:N-ethylmaleimide reductase